MDRTNAERQARWRAKRDAEIERLRKAAAKAAKAAAPSGSQEELVEAKREIARLTAKLEAETFTLHTEIARLRRELRLAIGARQEPAKAAPRPVQWQTPAQLMKWTSLPKGVEGFVQAKWLHGHKDQVIEIMMASFATGAPLDRVEQKLAELPGVYRIARIVGGSFGREGNDLRPQVRALMAVTERALEAQALPGGWAGGIVVYDPREPVT